MSPATSQYDLTGVIKMFSESVMHIFGENTEFSFLSGSVAYGGGLIGKSDIDIAVVLKNTHSLREQSDRNNAAIAFAKRYAKIHTKTGFVPDTLFPGEILTMGLCDDAIAGRGFSHTDGLIFLPQASNDYYCETPEHWFRAWLSMTAFSVFVSGNESIWKKKKQLAWGSILKYMFLKKAADPTSDSVIRSLMSEENKWIGFGITPNYYTFGEREADFIKTGLKSLSESNFLVRQSTGFTINAKALDEWERKTAILLEAKKMQNHDLFVTMADQYLISRTFNQI